MAELRMFSYNFAHTIMSDILYWSIQLHMLNCHSNMLKPYMEVLILSVLHVPPEKRPTENGVNAEKL